MNLRSLTLAAATSLLVGVLGCDPSKAELDRTKQELQSVTAERDNLKSQLDQANAKVTTLTTQVADLQAKATAAAEVPAKEEPAAPAPAKRAAAAKGKVGKPLTQEQKKEITEHPETRSGRGHF
jgi:chromosome segregation ATPase